MKKRLGEQVMVVTGASRGLGRTVARLAGARGARVVVTARSGDALDACVREIEAHGSEAIAVPADCSVQDEAGQVVEQALDRFGRIDSYVATAMVTGELRRIMDVTFFGQVYGYWAALPHLRDSRGTFVSVQSGSSASNAALSAYFESARVEIANAGWDVAVTAVPPVAAAVLHTCERPSRHRRWLAGAAALAEARAPRGRRATALR